MSIRQDTRGAGIGVSFFISTVIHLTVFLLAVWWGQLFPTNMALQQTYYVDITNLPVAEPRAGSPTQKGNEAEAPPPPKIVDRTMSVPVPKSVKTPAAEKQPTESSFAKRMAKLERKAESQQEEAALEQLRRRVQASGTGRAGMPAGTGKEAGSDYLAYIQSRLKDAFRETIDSASKNPEVVVRLFIDSDGKLARQKVEKTTGDRRFELSVSRAIEKASEKFVPPPKRKVFEGVFIFKPQGISRDRQ